MASADTIIYCQRAANDKRHRSTLKRSLYVSYQPGFFITIHGGWLTVAGKGDQQLIKIEG
ncbi:hypothetical protein EBAPG3_005315 [Nitrosospira lacus]|uniref:Uncharacterized protein n=1 Tax=Nitrosospira lacus TaxID=1288494 RepID=A0A1W6SN58_9PROT|nr:hypothetical protein [Nitrosospira lacus]ARO87233.1 hypothetical protein EBAPG3_005315 [Nitrosospira lacus]